jgi:hypothetical protein
MPIKPGKDISVDISTRLTFDILYPGRVADIKID